MKIIVLVKETFDTEARIELNHDGRIEEENIKKIMNPYDEYAVEEAVRIKEARGGEITAVSLGTDSAKEVLRQALAMGVDEAILLHDPLFLDGDSYSRAKVLAQAALQMEFDLILAGWVSIDEGCAQTASRVGEILNIPQVTVVTKLQIVDGKALVHRDSDDGTEIIEVPLPALLTVQKGINEPRYPSFKGIMQARKKELKKITAAELGIDRFKIGEYAPKIRIDRLEMPSPRAACKLMKGDPAEACKQLIDSLQPLNPGQ